MGRREICACSLTGGATPRGGAGTRCCACSLVVGEGAGEEGGIGARAGRLNSLAGGLGHSFPAVEGLTDIFSSLGFFLVRRPHQEQEGSGNWWFWVVQE